MEKVYNNIHQLLHQLYIDGGRLAPYADSVDWQARSMLTRTRIVGNLRRARSIRQILDNWPTMTRGGARDAGYNELYHLLSECFEVMTDDLMLLSAFELHAKARLLRKGYVIHNVKLPTQLKKDQSSRPIHVRSVRKAVRGEQQVRFSEFTLGIDTLLKPCYIRNYPLGPEVLSGLESIRNRRNLVHFNIAITWNVSGELLNFVDYLNLNIPLHKKHR